MFKYKKIFFWIITFSYLLLSLIELIKYFLIDSNLFGVLYLSINLVIILLLVPTTYNYKNNYSTARLSKILLIVFFGLFNSYLLYPMLVNSMDYIDSSNLYNYSIFSIKNILKLFIYFGFLLLALIDGKILKKIKNIFFKKTIDK